MKRRKTVLRPSWIQAARRYGEELKKSGITAQPEGWIQVNARWAEWVNSRETRLLRHPEIYRQAMRAFLKSVYGTIPRGVLLPTTKRVSAIVCVMNEEHTIGAVLEELARLPLAECIVVVNGCTDRSAEQVRSYPHVKVLEYEKPLGHDIGRSVGAAAATGDILLFVDGDIPVPAEHLAVFAAAIESGIDVALNDINGFLPPFARRDAVTRAKEFLNRCLGHSGLGANSLTSVPHAMTRQALERIGRERLAVPPLAHAAALLEGLAVGPGGAYNVLSHNRRRKRNLGSFNPVAEMILGDHAEALRYALDRIGERLTYPDHQRNRAAGGMQRADEHHCPDQ